MKKILIVDDEKEIRDLLKKKLKQYQYLALTAAKGQEALDICKTNKPDLILLDIIMADMDGYTFASELKKDKNTRDIPIIFQTGKELEPGGIKERVKDLGAFDYIMKPATFEELLATIKEAIG